MRTDTSSARNGRSALSRSERAVHTVRMGKKPVWDEMPDRDPLMTDMLEMEDDPSPEESALHMMGEPSYDDRDLDDLMEELADDNNP
jgi:hypothetical protein